MKFSHIIRASVLPLVLLLALLLALPINAAETETAAVSEEVTSFETLEKRDGYVLASEAKEALESVVDLEAFTEFILAQTSNCASQINIYDYQIPVSMAQDLADYIWYEVPEAFHCGQVGYSYAGNYLYTWGYAYDTYADTAEEYRACLADMKAGADYILSDIEGNNELTDVETALLLHDRLAIWAEYDPNDGPYPDEDYTAYGILGKRVGVCQGYTMAYMYLLNRVGIENDYCRSTGLNHAWNIVYIDGKPYHVDVTWDDPVSDTLGYVRHDNFLRSTEGLISTGHDYVDYITTPVDTTYDNAYWQVSDAAFQYLDGKLYYIDSRNYHWTLNCVIGDKTVQLLEIPGDTYNYCRSRLSSGNGFILYSTDNHIHAYDPVSGTTQSVYDYVPTGTNQERIEGFIYENGWLTLDIQERTPEYLYINKRIRVQLTLPDATVKNGWVDGRYYENDALVTNAWVEDEKGRFYVAGDGTLTTESWVTYAELLCYVGKDGYCVCNKWVGDAESGYCYLDKNGFMVTNDWVYVGSKAYYCDADGYRVTGTYIIDGREYRFTSDGVLITEDTMMIVNHPVDAFVDSGETVTFRVTTQGKVKSYRWQYRKIYKWFDTSMTGYNTDTLTVPATGARHGYAYRCEVTFADGTVQYSEIATLSVNTYIEITGVPNDQVVVLGYKGQFTVKAEGENLKYQWQYKRPDGDKWYETSMDGATKATLMVETTTSRDGYQYRCRIRDAAGKEVFSKPATMSVLSFKTHPQETFASTTETVKFTVTTSVDSGFTYQWQYRRSESGNWSNTTLAGYNTATLSVPAKGKNNYQYRCIVTGSKNSKLESKAATLHAGAPVVIQSQSTTLEAAVGETAVFALEATNAYSYQWYYRKSGGSTWSKTSFTGATTNTLQVPVIKSRNGYQYRCEIKGLDGKLYYSQPATLTVK